MVRLKGGAPSIFGRVGEEAAFTRRGVAVEVVPGVTAASAAAAQFGFPLTHRGEARPILFATARIENGELLTEGWAGGADRGTTLALYMARDAVGAVAKQLMALGRSPTTPAIAVENAVRPNARAIQACLGGMGEALGAFGFEGPVIVVVGDDTQAALARSAPSDASPRRPEPGHGLEGAPMLGRPVAFGATLTQAPAAGASEFRASARA